MSQIKQPEPKRLKITVGTPNSDQYLHRRFVQSLTNLKYPQNTEVQFSQVFGEQLPFARNHIVQDALENDSDYLFFVDADMVFPPDALIRLLNHEEDMVNALAFRRHSPHYPAVFEWNEEEECYETMDYSVAGGRLMEVDATGMACMLIKTDVLKDLDNPWYYYRDHKFSSDLTFCENARKAGFNIFVDTSLKIGHIGSQKIITEELYLQQLDEEAKEEWNRQMRKALKHDKRLDESSD